MTPKRIFLSPPHMGDFEQRFVQEAFESNYIAPIGPQVDAFEKGFSEYTGIKHCLALSSGTAAMHLALQELEVGPGDEIFASTLTFIGSISFVIYLGGSLLFIDCDRESWNMNPDLLAGELKAGKRRGSLPKAVIPTDLYGQCADYGRIYDICDSYGVPVVVDSAEAMGAFYRVTGFRDQVLEKDTLVGNIVRGCSSTGHGGQQPDVGTGRCVHAGKGAKAAVFSFNGNKIITTSGGGMLASDDKELIDHARKLSQQAKEDFPHYEHTEIGYNYRMSNILAAIGRGQLRVLDERVKKKREIFSYYKNALKDVEGIEFMPEAGYGRCNRWLTVILITPEKFGVDREAVRLALEAENIESRPVWKPMHLQPVFNPQITQIDADYKKKEKSYKSRVVGGKVAEDLFERGLCLPSGTPMKTGDMDRVIETILSCRFR